MIIDSNVLVDLLVDGWAQGRCVAHNWTHNPFPGHATVIRDWCNVHHIDSGDPTGFAVQEAQISERGQPSPRIAGFQEPSGRRRIMFSLSQTENPAAFAAALQLAQQHGFILLP